MNREIASGASWMVLFKLVDRALAVVSTVILARLLVPEDFGLVAMAMSVIGVIELATSFSFEVALIQRREVQREHYDTAWTLNVLIALGCGAAIALLAYPTAAFYEEPRLAPVMLVLAGGWALSGVENVGIVDFRRRMDFRREFLYLATRRLLGFVVTATLAFALRSYWALVVGTIASRFIGVGLSYAMHPFRPRPGLAHASELLGFSGWVLANNVFTVLQSKIPHFVVGRMLGAHPLGVLTLSTDIAQLPASDLAAPINRAVFPGFSRMAHDMDVLRRSFLDVVGMTMLVSVPAAVGIAAVAEPLVRVALGPRWMEAVPIIQILALAAAAAAATSNNGSAYLAIGRPKLIAFILAVRLSMLVPLAVGLTHAFGLVGAAYAELLTSLLIVGISLHVLFRQLQLPYARYFSRIWRPLLAGAAMGGAVLAVVQSLPSESALEAGRTLLAGIAVGVLSYSALVVALWLASGRPEGPEAALYRRLRGARPRTLTPT